jgi:hypothetical protein
MVVCMKEKRRLTTEDISSPPIIGTAIIYSITPTSETRIGLLIAFYCTQFYLAEGNLIFSLISRNIAGQTKKSTTLAMTFVAWAAGNMTAPQVRNLVHTALSRNPLSWQIVTCQILG